MQGSKLYFNSDDTVVQAVNQAIPGIEEVATKKFIDFTALKERALEHVEKVLDNFLPGGKYQGKEYVVENPARNDLHLGSFTINTQVGLWKDFSSGEGGGDLISLVNFVEGGIGQRNAGEKLEDFLNSLITSDPMPQTKRIIKASKDDWTPILPVPVDAPKNLPNHFQLGQPSTTWAYKDLAGKLLGYACRFELSDGEKEIRPLTFCKNQAGVTKWWWHGFTTPRPLYGLEKLAARPEATVVACEGEKAADAAQELFPDYVCMSFPHGALSADKADWSAITGRKIIIWPDNDEAGKKCGETIVECLRRLNVTANISVLKIPDGKAKGWDAADALAEGWDVKQAQWLEAAHSAQPAEDSFPFVPGYRVCNEGVFQAKLNKKGDAYEVQISSRIDVVARTRNEQNENWGLLLQFKDHDGCVHEWAMPRNLLAGGGELYRQQLLSLGADLLPGLNTKEALNAYFIACNPTERALCVENTGWHGNVFVLPNRTFGQSTERVILQSVDASKSLPFGVSGTLDEWKNAVASKCIGNSRLVLAVSVALSGPFLEPLELENGGFHFRGPSSSGKTKTLNVAGSVWGNKKMVRTWRTTGNAIESLAVDHNDCVLILDELGQLAPDEAGEIAYTLANGQSKARANRFGNARPTTNWKLLFLSTGEIGLAEHVAAADKQIRAGQEIRMLDIPSDAGVGLGVFEDIHGAASPQAFADSLQTLSQAFYGTAAEALLLRVTQNPEALAEAVLKVKAWQQRFIEDFVTEGAHGQVFRAAARMGMVAGVGEYCIESGILPWPVGEAIKGVGQCFKAWVENRGGNEAAEDVRALAQIRRFLELHGTSRFAPVGLQGIQDMYDERTINRAGFKKVNEEGAIEYWVLPQAYKTELCRGFDPTLVTRILKEGGFLQTANNGKATMMKRLPGLGPARVYVIKPSIFGAEEGIAA